jgi:hypothetical protein
MIAKGTAALLLIALIFSASAGCKNAKLATKNSIETGVATINLSAVTKSNQTQTFREVTRASLLPKAVLDQFLTLPTSSIRDYSCRNSWWLRFPNNIAS